MECASNRLGDAIVVTGELSLRDSVDRWALHHLPYLFPLGAEEAMAGKTIHTGAVACSISAKEPLRGSDAVLLERLLRDGRAYIPALSP
jgi:hypothetical protein